MINCTSQGHIHLFFGSRKGSSARATYLDLVQGVRVGQDAQGPDGVSGLLRRGWRWEWSCWLQRGSRSCQSSPSPPGNTHNIGFNCCEASPDLCQAHGNPAGSKVEDFVASCRHQIHPAGHGEEAEEQGGSSHVSWKICPRKRIFLIIFLNNTSLIHMKILAFYVKFTHLH